MKKSLRVFFGLMCGVLLLSFLAACGGGGGIAVPSGSGAQAFLISIEVAPTNPRIALSTTKQFTATGIYSDHTSRDLTASATWSSSAAGVAGISNNAGSNGLATSLAAGSTSITAMVGTISGSTTLTVTSATLVSIGVTPTDPSIALGTTEQFTATGIFSDNTSQDLTASVTWSSSAAGVAGISSNAGSNGLATSLAAGSTIITATSGAISGSSTLTVTSATLVSIGVTPTNPSIALGTTEQFTATGIFSDNTSQDLTASVTWSSSAAGVAGISNNAGSSGLATSAAAGSTIITATSGAISGSSTLTVTSAFLQAIDVTPVIPNIVLGTTQQFVATGTYSNNTTEDLTAAVTWSSSNKAVATVSNASGSNGLATSVGAGLTTVTATLGLISGSTDLTVVSATLVSIDVAPTDPSVPMGLTQQFTASGNYSDGTVQDLTLLVTWSSSDPGVATVSNAAGSNGLATPVAAGLTTITASLGGISGTSNLTITSATLTSIAISPGTPQMALGTALQFNAIGTYSDSTTQDITAVVTWSSSDGTVAIVSDAESTRGLATSVGAGTTTITAALGTVTNTVTLKVTTATLASIAVTPSNSTIFLGAPQQFTATGQFSDNSTQDLTSQVAWRSSNKTIAAISNASGSNGLVTPIKSGSTTISATFAHAGVTVTGTTQLTVSSATLQSIIITPVNPSIAVKKTLQFTATGNYGGGLTQDLTTSVNLTWTSSSNAVATVVNAPKKSKGLATGVSTGSVTITATLRRGAGSGTKGTTILTVM